MDVHLLVYDLSRGLARQMSQSMLGFHLDAIYHTSIQLNGREYVYDGGIVAITPGSSHLGQPMERVFLGKTELPMVVIEEFLESLRPIFTVEVSIPHKFMADRKTDQPSGLRLVEAQLQQLLGLACPISAWEGHSGTHY